MASGKFTTWGYTLNNYTDQELQAVRNPPEWVREHVWELERGKEGTPHVQGWFRCKTQVRTSHIVKHWLTRAHLNGLTTEEYKQNMKAYAQKQDATATSAATLQRSSEPILFPAVIPEMLVEWIDSQGLYPSGTGWEEVYLHKPMDSPRLVRSLVNHSPSLWYDHWRKEGHAMGADGTPRPDSPPGYYPWKAVLAVAKRALVERYRVETLVSRPEVDQIVRSYYDEILKRIQHKRNAIDTTETKEHPPLPPSPEGSVSETEDDEDEEGSA